MNCTICGSPFVMGSDNHKTCRLVQQLCHERDLMMDEMLDWYLKHKDCCSCDK